MFKKSLLAAALAVAAAPSDALAWGAAHVGYTHVGPNGVYHTGRTAAAGPNGVYAGGHTNAYGYGGGAYHAGYQVGRPGYGGAYGGAYGGGYRYGTTGYGAAGGAAYGYVR